MYKHNYMRRYVCIAMYRHGDMRFVYMPGGAGESVTAGDVCGLRPPTVRERGRETKGWGQLVRV